MPATATILQTNDVILAPLALTTVEDTITFAAPPAVPTQPTGKGKADVVLQSDNAWFYSQKTGGPYFLVGPYQPFRLDGVAAGLVIFVKAQAGTPNLYGMVAK